MPYAKPLPRKYLESISEAQEQLRLVAVHSRLALTVISETPREIQRVKSILRDIEAASYRIALELSDLEFAGHCDDCPSAPPVTSLQAHALVLASELERQAQLVRRHIEGDKPLSILQEKR